jgi:hypothetical protein
MPGRALSAWPSDDPAEVATRLTDRRADGGKDVQAFGRGLHPLTASVFGGDMTVHIAQPYGNRAAGAEPREPKN